MPFKSEAQRRWMWINEPEMAQRWEAETPKKKLPMRIKPKTVVEKHYNIFTHRRPPIADPFDPNVKMDGWAVNYISTLKALSGKHHEDPEAIRAHKLLWKLQHDAWKHRRGDIWIPSPDKIHGHFSSYGPVPFDHLRRALRKNTSQGERNKSWNEVKKIEGGVPPGPWKPHKTSKEIDRAEELQAHKWKMNALQKKRLLATAVGSLPFAEGQFPVHARGRMAGEINLGHGRHDKLLIPPTADEKERNSRRPSHSTLRFEDLKEDPAFKLGEGFNVVQNSKPMRVVRYSEELPWTSGNRMVDWVAQSTPRTVGSIAAATVGAVAIGETLRRLSRKKKIRIPTAMAQLATTPLHMIPIFGSAAANSIAGGIAAGNAQREADEASERRTLDEAQQNEWHNQARQQHANVENESLRRHQELVQAIREGHKTHTPSVAQSKTNFSTDEVATFYSGIEYSLGDIRAKVRGAYVKSKNWMFQRALPIALRGATVEALNRLKTAVPNMPEVSVDLIPIRSKPHKIEDISTWKLHRLVKQTTREQNNPDLDEETKKGLSSRLNRIRGELDIRRL